MKNKQKEWHTATKPLIFFIYFVQDKMIIVAYKKVNTSCQVMYICIHK
jgi:hypothetical protein